MDLKSSAVFRMRNSLSYRFGAEILKINGNFLYFFKLPCILMKIFKEYKKERQIYNFLIKFDKSFALRKLSDYYDFQDAESLKESLEFKLGSEFIKAYKTWYLGSLMMYPYTALRLISSFKEQPLRLIRGRNFAGNNVVLCEDVDSFLPKKVLQKINNLDNEFFVAKNESKFKMIMGGGFDIMGILTLIKKQKI